TGRGILADQAERAARLAKADLVTGMVGEFPELQGLMGGYYAAAQGEAPAVAEAIRDHYKPVGQGDDVPTAPVTVAVSLADKLDTLLAFFGEEMFPTGSKDPFALRRAGLGYLQLIQRNALELELSTVSRVWTGHKASGILGLVVADFLFDRLGVQLRDDGVRYDFIQASRAWTSGDTDGRVDRVEKRARALAAFLRTEDGANLLAGYKRAANILKKEGVTDAAWSSPTYTPEPAEADLIAALDAAGPAAADAVGNEDFEAAMAALATLRAPIDAFFDAVTVNDADPVKRAARLALLARVRDAVHGVADFSKIEG
uniref:glycine--tRNA ligase subunit beta n=1 Tax=Sphingomonas pruni TaxID=40683 RepID=UPI000A4B9622